jgi:glyoxalase family protein
VALAVPLGSLTFWAGRLTENGIAVGETELRFGETVLAFADPHGLSLALTETADAREFSPWKASSVPAAHQIRGLHGIRILERDLAPTIRFLSESLGFARLAEEAGWHRFVVSGGGSGRFVDLQELPDARRGTWGTGSVHHVAWRVPDDDAELAVQEGVRAAGRHPTDVIDRFWFKSVYFKEPGGALFEVATDGPGFTVDESPDTLGTQLVLPPWLEPQRPRIEAALPPLRDPPRSSSLER